MQTPEPSVINTDVLIIGAGPAGSAAAITLAKTGRQVLLIDQHDFPRDKICGDGLIPDAMLALERLGVLEEVHAVATPIKGLTCHGPKGGSLDIPAKLAVLPRKTLDHLLVKTAIHAGATFKTPWRYLRPLTQDGRVIGAEIAVSKTARPHTSFSRINEADANDATDKTDTTDTTIKLIANWTILASGASSTALISAQHCTRVRPSAIALRGYVHNPNFDALDERLHVSWHKSYAPGYGWIFPCPDGMFNIGIGLFGMHTQSWRHQMAKWPGLTGLKPRKANLQSLFQHFVDTNPLAQALMETGTLVGSLKGAPLRCSLDGARPASAGLLVTGEAIGSTYGLTGEGIGKAMETGMLAAQALISQQSDTETVAKYQRALKQLTPKFDTYQRANIVNHLPWLIDMTIHRGNKSPKLVSRMSLVLEEKANPGKLFTVKGAWKFLTD